MRHLFALILIACATAATAQNGGNGVYSILRQPVGARMAAWGGYCNAYTGRDLTLSAVNPALLSPDMHHRFAMNFNTQMKGVWSGNAAYARNVKNVGTAALHIMFLDFGRMPAYDAGGNPEGTVQANETVITAGLGRQLHPQLRAGANLKFVYSILGQYISTGAAIDLGAVWSSRDSLFTAAATVRNMGLQLMTYVDGRREKLPLSAELGINFKPRHMPFRFNVVAHSLQRFDLTYSQYLQSNTIDLSGQQQSSPEASFGDKVLRHFTVGTELVLGKHFGIMGGYSHQRRREMAPDIRPGMAGFSWGLHFRISKVQITYASSAWFPGFNANLFTFTSLISDFKRKSATSRP